MTTDNKALIDTAKAERERADAEAREAFKHAVELAALHDPKYWRLPRWRELAGRVVVSEPSDVALARARQEGAEAMREAFERGFDAGFAASSEGRNGEYGHPAPDDPYYRQKRTDAAALACLDAASAAPAAPAEVREALRDAIDAYDATVCLHEEVERGGTSWTICQQCGAKWHDADGGFNPPTDDPRIARARATLARLDAAAGGEGGRMSAIDVPRRLTRDQAAIISAYTGVLVGPISDMHEYVKRKLGRPVWSHEYADETIQQEIREATRADLEALLPNVEGGHD